MLRLLLRTVSINLLSIYIVTQVLGGVIVYYGGYKTLLYAAFAITIVNLFVRPVVNLLLLPVHLVTLGVFRWVANIVTLYVVTWIIKDLQIQQYYFSGASLGILNIPPINFSAFGSFVVVTMALTIIFHLLYWLFQD
jgi:putative membrane protein